MTVDLELVTKEVSSALHSIWTDDLEVFETDFRDAEFGIVRALAVAVDENGNDLDVRFTVKVSDLTVWED